jgi:hypothetical protein
MPTKTTIKRTVTIKKYKITTRVAHGKSSTVSSKAAMSVAASNIPNSSDK